MRIFDLKNNKVGNKIGVFIFFVTVATLFTKLITDFDWVMSIEAGIAFYLIATVIEYFNRNYEIRRKI